MASLTSSQMVLLIPSLDLALASSSSVFISTMANGSKYLETELNVYKTLLQPGLCNIPPKQLNSSERESFHKLSGFLIFIGVGSWYYQFRNYSLFPL